MLERLRSSEGAKKMSVNCADEHGQRQSEDIYIVDRGSSFKDVHADEAIHECMCK